MQQWEFVEALLPPFQTNKEKKQLAYNIRIISSIVLIVALGIILTSINNY